MRLVTFYLLDLYSEENCLGTKNLLIFANFARKIQILGLSWYIHYIHNFDSFFLSFRARWGGDFYAPSTVTDNILPLITHKAIQENWVQFIYEKTLKILIAVS